MTGADSIQKFLEAGLAESRRRNFAAAAEACEKALALAPAHADALQLLGLIRAEQGQADEARRLMERSLELNRAQPHVLNNLANLLLRGGERALAIALFREAAGLQADYGDAWLNLGAALAEEGDGEAAAAALAQAESLMPADARPLTLRGTLAQRGQRFADAEKLFRRALAINPEAFAAVHNLGFVLKAQGRLDEALAEYRRAERINPSSPELQVNLANLFFEQGEIDEAIARYRRALDLKPDFLEAHRSLNEILWRHGRTAEHLASFPAAIARKPGSASLRFKYAESLLTAGRQREAAAALEEMAAKGLDTGAVRNLLGKALTNLGQREAGLSALEDAIRLEPDAPAFRKDVAKVLIGLGREADALAHLEAALKMAPFNQEFIAYQGLCWRLVGDPRAKWLNDYERFVHPVKLDPPDGYASLEAFSAALDRALDPYHRDRMQPSDQSFTGGTQSPAALLDRKVPEIAALKGALERAVARYIEGLPDDAAHPFLKRKSKRFRFAGSWSIRLKAQGFHVNHVHPEGWISSSYYVALPREVGAGPGHAGWIKFGESPLGLGPREEIAMRVRPEAGLLVLFPSYVFHGTYPFSSDEARTTLPFDVTPLNP